MAVLALPVAADARTGYCSPTGDYCTSVRDARGGPLLRLGSFAFSGRYRICVTPPRGSRTCRSFRLRRGRLFESTVRWSRHFPDRGKGVYRVRWLLGSTKLGPRLGFRR